MINEAGGAGEVGVGVGTVRVRGVGGVEDGIVSLEPNDDFTMGAPLGAPGAIGAERVWSWEEEQDCFWRRPY